MQRDPRYKIYKFDSKVPWGLDAVTKYKAQNFQLPAKILFKELGICVRERFLGIIG